MLPNVPTSGIAGTLFVFLSQKDMTSQSYFRRDITYNLRTISVIASLYENTEIILCDLFVKNTLGFHLSFWVFHTMAYINTQHV